MVTDDKDDVVRELLEVCDRNPREGLEWIERLDQDIQYLSVVLFAKFIAQRHLAFQCLHAANIKSFINMSVADISDHVNESQFNFALGALQTVALLETHDPDYIDSRGERDSNFAAQMVDDVCILAERMRPTSVQSALGWTKLEYLGKSRVGFAPGFLSDEVEPSIQKTFGEKVRCSTLFASAIGLQRGHETDGREYVSYQLLEKNYKETPTVGDAGMLDIIRVYSGHSRTVQSQDQQSSLPDEISLKIPVWNWVVGGVLLLLVAQCVF